MNTKKFRAGLTWLTLLVLLSVGVLSSPLAMPVLADLDLHNLTWSVNSLVDESETVFSQCQTSNPRSVRGLALSPDGNYLYLSYLQDPNYAGRVRKIDLSVADFEDQVVNELQLIDHRPNDPNNSAKALAVDDQGRVYMARGSGIQIWDADLGLGGSGFAGTEGTSGVAPLYLISGLTKVEGVAVTRESGTLVVYASDRTNATLQRFELTESGGGIIGHTQAGLGGSGSLTVSGASDLRGLEVAPDGTIWMADNSAGTIFRFNPDGTSPSPGSAAAANAFDVAFDGGTALVSTNSGAVVALNVSDMSLATTLTPPFAALGLDIGQTGLAGIDAIPNVAFYVANEDGQRINQPIDGCADDNDDNAPVLKAVVLSEVWVDDDYCDGCGNDGHTWGYDAFATIQDGIDAVAPAGTVHVAAGTYNENIDITKGLTLQSTSGAASTTIAGTGSTAAVTISADNVEVNGFTITNFSGSGADIIGIYANDHSTLTIKNNIVTNVGDGTNKALGIVVVSSSAAVSGITIKDNQIDHIASGGVDGAGKGYSASGIAIGWSTGAQLITGLLIQNNTISNITANTSAWPVGHGAYGILINHSTGSGGQTVTPQILDNTISTLEGFWAHGIGLEGDTPNAVVQGNTISGLTDHKTPSDAVGVFFQDNSSGATVTVSENHFDAAVPWGVAIHPDDLPGGSNGYNYVADASGNWWGDASGPSGEGSGSGAGVGLNVDYTPWLDSGADTSTDPGFQGDFSVLNVDDDSPQTGTTGRIQEGVDSVSGSTVNVAAGTYEEQVEITKNLAVQGAGSGTIILSPDTLTKFFATSSNNYPIVYIHDANNVTVKDLTVDGAGKGNANYRFQGIGYHNAGGTVDTVEIKDVRDTPFSGAQHGVALYVFNEDDVSRTINVWDSTFTGFQKNAMALNANSTTPLTVDVRRNTVTGYGTTDVTAQNGIQVYADLGTGVVDDNTVSGIGYDNTTNPTKWVASSILDYYSDVTITNNIVTGAQVGVYYIDGSGNIQSNDITVEQIGDGGSWGIIATDPPAAVPSPFDAKAVQSVSYGQTLSIQSTMATLNVDLSGNTVTFSGPDNTDVFGIEADAGYGPDDIAAHIDNNTVTGFEAGIEVWMCQSSCDTGVFTAVSANNNCLSGNTYGLRSNADYITVDAENNWWGNASGPYHATDNPSGTGDDVSDYVDFAPWLDACGGNPTGNWQNTTTGEYYATLQDAVNDAAPGEQIDPVGGNNPSGGATVNSPGVTINLGGGTYGPGSPFLTVAAADVAVLGPGTLDGGGSTDPAILINSGGDNFTLKDVEVKGWADGVEVAASVTSLKLVSNFLHNNTGAGLQVDSGVVIGGIVTIEGNLFKDNGGNGIQNDGTTDPLPAEYNSWGDLAGPSSTNGDGVSAKVDADPFTFVEVFLDVDPDTEAVQRNVDESTSFDVKLKVDAAKLYGLTFKFTYDTAKLTLNSTTFESPWSAAGRCSALAGLPAGTIGYRCNLQIPDSEVDADGGTVATFNFTAEDNGGLTGDGPWTAYFDIAHAEADTSAGAQGGVKVYVNNAGFNDPSITDRDITDSNDGQIDIRGIGQFTGFVDLQGRADDSAATIEVYDQATKTSATKLADATSGAGGDYTTAYVSPNLLTIGTTYYLVVDRPLYLPTTAVTVTVTAYAHSKGLTTRPHTTLATVKLLGGDATNDDVVDIGDAGCIGGDYGKSSGFTECGGSGSGGTSDVNGDGVVDILDLVLMGGNYQRDSSSWTP